MDGLVHWWYDLTTRVSRRLASASPRPASRLTELPPDVLRSIFHLLTGFDLLLLSHVNRHFFHEVLASDGEVWQRLAPSGSPSDSLSPQLGRCTDATETCASPASVDTAKQRYLSRRSLRFHGARVRQSDRNDRGGGIVTPCPAEIASAGSFSFDLVFAPSPPLDANLTRPGGVLLGAQSVRATRDSQANTHKAFVRTDAAGNLYCSFMNHERIVAETLAFQRWYHVALVFEVTAPSLAKQRVYLDGELVDTAQGWFHDDWASLSDMQLGTGCITGGPFGNGVTSWYAFNGLVDECRFWHGALRFDQVYRFAVSKASCVWSMRDVAKKSSMGYVSTVRSTSPAERKVCDVEITGVLSTVPIPRVRIVYCF